MTIRDELLDELSKEYKNSEDLFGKDEVFKELRNALLKRQWTPKLPTTLAIKSIAPSARIPATPETVNLQKPQRVLSEIHL
jgi:hypothetical protein